MKTAFFIALVACALVANASASLVKETLKKGDCSVVAKSGDSVKVVNCLINKLEYKELLINNGHCHVFLI
jgi:hypothetical protein